MLALLGVNAAYAQSRAAAQRATDEKLITEYLAKNNITATRTKSGLYYVITKQGTGKNAWRGQTVTLNYTGKTLDGVMFDSNLDPAFNHVAPLTCSIGMGQVIKGWDEGIQLLNTGSKATLVIPSHLAYGDKAVGEAIPANSVLVFDVELVSIDK